MSNKVNINEFIKVDQLVAEVFAEVAPTRELNLTEHQLERFEKKLSERIATRFLNSTKDALLAGDSLEFPHQFNVAATASTVRKNEDGSPVRKISVKTRTTMKNELN